MIPRTFSKPHSDKSAGSYWQFG